MMDSLWLTDECVHGGLAAYGRREGGGSGVGRLSVYILIAIVFTKVIEIRRLTFTIIAAVASS